MCVTWRLIWPKRRDKNQMLLFGTHSPMNWKQWLSFFLEEEDDAEDIEMPGDELRDGSEGEEQEPMEDGEQRDGSVAEHAGLLKRDLERVKKALMKLHANLGHPGVIELIRVLKHGRASELAIQEARRMRCDACAENVSTKTSTSCGPSSSAGFQ